MKYIGCFDIDINTGYNYCFIIKVDPSSGRESMLGRYIFDLKKEDMVVNLWTDDPSDGIDSLGGQISVDVPDDLFSTLELCKRDLVAQVIQFELDEEEW